MYNFIIILKEPGLNLSLAFKEEGLAKVARENIHAAKKKWLSDPNSDSNITIKDDYGHHLDVMVSNIAAVLIQDQYAATERDQEQQVDKARQQENFLKRRSQDMELMRLFPAAGGLPNMGRA